MKRLLCFIALLLAINANAATYFFNRFTTNAETAVGNMTLSGLSVTGAVPGTIKMTDASGVLRAQLGTNDNFFLSNSVTAWTVSATNGGITASSNITAESMSVAAAGKYYFGGSAGAYLQNVAGTLSPSGPFSSPGTITAIGNFIGPNGSAAAPSYSFINATDRGMYAGTISDRVLHWAIEGAEVMKLDRFGELFTFEAIILHNLVRLDGVGTHLQWTDPNGKGPYLIPSQQAGHTNVTAGTSLVISFAVTMQGTNYTAMCVNNGAALTGFFVSNKTPTNFTANFAIITGSDIDWQITEHTQ